MFFKWGAWEWGTGDLGAYRLFFFKSSKDRLHYSMLFLEMSQVFSTSIVDELLMSLRTIIR